jgi:hypothetical protein
LIKPLNLILEESMLIRAGLGIKRNLKMIEKMGKTKIALV